MKTENLPPNLEQVKEYILTHWDGTVRSTPHDEGSAVAVPYPYTVPSLKDSFQELYYWDLYFTSLGLLVQGRTDLAVGNTLDLMSLVDRFGFVPNGNRTFYLNRSQLPLLGPLIALVAAAKEDSSFALEAAPVLEREYQFWTTKRLSPTGLSCSGNQATRQELIDFYPVVAQRIGIAGRPPEECLEILSHTMAECEVWDFTPRFNHLAKNFCAIDLNSYLYTDELLLAAWSEGAVRAGWQDKARQRRKRINELCWDEERGGFFDYDFVEKKRGTFVTAAALQPLWSGLATERQAARTVEKILPQLEFSHGVSAGALPEKPHRVCQWDYPNAWPPLQHVAYRGLQRYGYLDEARRIARKYVETVCRGVRDDRRSLGEVQRRRRHDEDDQRNRLYHLHRRRSRSFAAGEGGLRRRRSCRPDDGMDGRSLSRRPRVSRR